jgi:hypothetical protein
MKEVKIYFPNGAVENHSEEHISYTTDIKKIVVSIHLLQSNDIQIKFDDGSEKIYINMLAVIYY